MTNRRDILRTSLISVLAGLVIGAVIILLLGKNPLSAYYNLLQGCGLAFKNKYAAGHSNITDLVSYSDFLTPMIFAALAVAVALKAGLFNIGVSGQMLAAGFTATVLIGYSPLPAVLAKPMVVLVGLVVGALFGALVGFLKFRFNINEVVSTIMLNYTIEYVVSFFINTRFVDPVSRQSRNIAAAARLTLKNTQMGGYKYDLPIGFLLALVAVVLVRFIIDKTVLGFELKAVGLNRRASEYAGIKTGRSMVLAMLISGALAGMAGVTYYLGYVGSIQPKTLPSIGFDSIAVCLVGNSNPFGILISTLLLEIISNGSTYMSSRSGLESEIASVITAIILLSTTVSVLWLTLGRKLFPGKRTGKGGEKA